MGAGVSRPLKYPWDDVDIMLEGFDDPVGYRDPELARNNVYTLSEQYIRRNGLPYKTRTELVAGKRLVRVWWEAA